MATLTTEEIRMTLLALNTQMSEAQRNLHDGRQADLDRELNGQVVETLQGAIRKVSLMLAEAA